MRRRSGFDTCIFYQTMQPRFFCCNDIFIGQTLELDLATGHHASRVLRLKPGNAVIVFNGKGGEFHARIENIRKTSTTVIVGQFEAVERESPLTIEIAQAVCVNEKMDWIIQKSIELGATSIQPLFTTRSIVRLSEERAIKRLRHWQKIIISACEQCCRNRIPIISPPLTLTDWLSCRKADQPSHLNFMLSVNGDQRLKNLPEPSSNTSMTLTVGPEGGWTPEEEDILHQHGFIALKVGQRIMRTETAALATLAAIQTYWGDF